MSFNDFFIKQLSESKISWSIKKIFRFVFLENKINPFILCSFNALKPPLSLHQSHHLVDHVRDRVAKTFQGINNTSPREGDISTSCQLIRVKFVLKWNVVIALGDPLWPPTISLFSDSSLATVWVKLKYRGRRKTDPYKN